MGVIGPAETESGVGISIWLIFTLGTPSKFEICWVEVTFFAIIGSWPNEIAKTECIGRIYMKKHVLKIFLESSRTSRLGPFLQLKFSNDKKTMKGSIEVIQNFTVDRSLWGLTVCQSTKIFDHPNCNGKFSKYGNKMAISREWRGWGSKIFRKIFFGQDTHPKVQKSPKALGAANTPHSARPFLQFQLIILEMVA